MQHFIKALIKSLARPVMNNLRARFVSRAEWKQLNSQTAQDISNVRSELDSLNKSIEEHVRMADNIHRDVLLQLSMLAAQGAEISKQLSWLNAKYSVFDDLYSKLSDRQTASDDQQILLNLKTNEIINKLHSIQHITAQAVRDILRKSLPLQISQNDNTSITVIITTCNRPVLLKNAIQSVINQSRRPDKIIIIDDGDVDVSIIVDSFFEENILYLKTKVPRSGVSIAKNMGLDATNTDLVAWLDDDNLMCRHGSKASAPIWKQIPRLMRCTVRSYEIVRHQYLI